MVIYILRDTGTFLGGSGSFYQCMFDTLSAFMWSVSFLVTGVSPLGFLSMD